MKLEEYEKLIEGEKCRWCERELPPKISYYPHPDGWKVEHFDFKLWLYVECPNCGYRCVLWKLGIPRGEDYIPDKYFVEERRNDE